MGIPRHLASGERLPAAWLNQIVDELRARSLSVGPGLQLKRTPSGTTVSLVRQQRVCGTPDDLVVGVVTSEIKRGVGIVAVPRGTGELTRTSDYLAAPEVSQLSSFPAGCAVLAHRIDAELVEITIPPSS